MLFLRCHSLTLSIKVGSTYHDCKNIVIVPNITHGCQGLKPGPYDCTANALSTELTLSPTLKWVFISFVIGSYACVSSFPCEVKAKTTETHINDSEVFVGHLQQCINYTFYVSLHAVTRVLTMAAQGEWLTLAFSLRGHNPSCRERHGGKSMRKLVMESLQQDREQTQADWFIRPLGHL